MDGEIASVSYGSVYTRIVVLSPNLWEHYVGLTGRQRIEVGGQKRKAEKQDKRNQLENELLFSD